MKKITIAVLIIFGLVYLTSWRNFAPSNNGVAVTTGIASVKSLSESILSSGNLVYDKQIQIRSEVIGIVSKVFVEEGDFVNKGQTLLELDQTTFKADVADNQASVNAHLFDIELLLEEDIETTRQLELSKKLGLKSALSLNEIKKLQSESRISKIRIKSAKELLNRKIALLNNAQARLNKTIFKAPITGVVSQIDVKVGETVISGTTNIIGSSLMTLIDPNSAIVKLKVDEADIGNVFPGQEVEVYTSANPKSAIKGKVTKISSTAQKESGNQGLFFYVDAKINKNNNIFSGMSCRADIIIENTEPSITVPISAIQNGTDLEFVWLVKNNIATRQEVTTGMANDIDQVIVSGLREGDRVVTGSARTMKNLIEGTVLEFNNEVL